MFTPSSRTRRVDVHALLVKNPCSNSMPMTHQTAVCRIMELKLVQSYYCRCRWLYILESLRPAYQLQVCIQANWPSWKL